jgi:hypothetical protein
LGQKAMIFSKIMISLKEFHHMASALLSRQPGRPGKRLAHDDFH